MAELHIQQLLHKIVHSVSTSLDLPIKLQLDNWRYLREKQAIIPEHSGYHQKNMLRSMYTSIRLRFLRQSQMHEPLQNLK